MIRYFFILLLLFGIISKTFGQLIADAGLDTIIVCTYPQPALPSLGGNPTAIGGTAPYQYEWTTSYKLSHLEWDEEDFLNDPAYSNPTLKTFITGQLLFKLTVTDKNGLTAKDSILVRFSSFAMTLEEKSKTIHEGESAQLYTSVMGGIPPLSFQWTPLYNISDPAIENPIVSPTASTTYHLEIRDSAGCEGFDDYFIIEVIPLSSITDPRQLNKSTLYPNPVSENTLLTFTNPTKTETILRVYSSKGDLILEKISSEESFMIGSYPLDKGTYTYSLNQQNKIISTGKLIKN